MVKFTIATPAKVGQSRARPNGEFSYSATSLIVLSLFPSSLLSTHRHSIFVPILSHGVRN